MASDLQQTLDRISRKARLLTERYSIVLKERDEAQARIEELETTVYDMRKEIEELNRRVEYLTIVTTAIPLRKDIELSRARLSELVREIDRCISELSE